MGEALHYAATDISVPELFSLTGIKMITEAQCSQRYTDHLTAINKHIKC